MYAISSVNEGKYKVLSDAMVGAFGQPTKSLDPIQVGEPTTSAWVDKSQRVKSPRPLLAPVPPVETDSANQNADDQRALDKIADGIQEKMAPLIDKEKAMEFLKRAERYAEARGDEFWFKNLYTGFREYNGVTDSVWKALSYLYGDYTADLLEFQ